MTTLRSLEGLLVTKLRANKHRLRKVAVVQQAAGLLPRGRPGKNVALRPHVNEANCIALLLGYYAADEVQYAAEEATAFYDLAPKDAKECSGAPALVDAVNVWGEVSRDIEFRHPYYFGQTLVYLVTVGRQRPEVSFDHLRIELIKAAGQRAARVSMLVHTAEPEWPFREAGCFFGDIHPDSVGVTVSIPLQILDEIANLLGPIDPPDLLDAPDEEAYVAEETAGSPPITVCEVPVGAGLLGR